MAMGGGLASAPCDVGTCQGFAMKSGVGSIRHPGTQFFEKSKKLSEYTNRPET
jgi:hypothetical protein